MSVDPAVAATGQPYEYVGDNPVNATDPLGMWGTSLSGNFAEEWHDISGAFTHQTIGLCVNGEEAGGAAGFGSACIGFSGGHFFTMESAGGGGGSPNAGVSVGLLISNATNPHQLAGPFAAAGASAKPFDQGPSVGADGAYGEGSCNSGIWEAQPEVGLSAQLPWKIPYEAHGGVSATWVQEP